MKKFGFTLAEILITLGVIGVVAAITLHNLIINYQKTITAEKLKKGLTTFSNVIVRAEEEYGNYKDWIYPTSATDDTGKDDFVNQYIAPFIKIVSKSQRNGQIHTLNGSGVLEGNHRYWYYLSDGSCFAIYHGHQGIHAYVSIYYDINGNKGPNRYGKDIFRFSLYYVVTEGLYKNYYDGGIHNLQTGYYDSFKRESVERLTCTGSTVDCCNKEVTGYYGGQACGALIQKNNWKIPDYYPW